MVQLNQCVQAAGAMDYLLTPACGVPGVGTDPAMIGASLDPSVASS